LQVCAVDAADVTGAVLLPVLGSGVVLVMLTALVIEPAPAETCTVRVNVPLAPLARLALVTVSAPLLVSSCLCWLAR
jgi:hypothetical protein